LQNFDLLEAWRYGGMKSCDFYCTSFEPFCVKIGWGSDLQRWAGKKSQKVTRGSHRNDVSPLIQGLRNSAACDYGRFEN